jgi:uncharacterized SAM-binding protein YcdF (DUF218 family)
MMLYDAVIVLSGGIRKTTAGFATTTYADDDGFGMMGGHIRVLAAVALHNQQAAETFVFTSGITAKTIHIFGPDVPSEASVYSKEFLERITPAGAAPAVILEERSTNTIGNVKEFAAIMKANGWKNVAVLSSEYHLPRIKALCTLLGIPGQLLFLSAEEIVQREWLGRYDDEIKTAYASEAGKKRLQNEAGGTAAIKAGGYNPAEHQLGT